MVQGDAEFRDARQAFLPHGLLHGESVSAAAGETDFGLEQKLVLFQVAVALARPFAVLVTQHKTKGVLGGVSVGEFRGEENIEVLHRIVGVVAQIQVEVIVLQRIGDVHLEGEQRVDMPALLVHGDDFLVKSLRPAGA